MRKTLKAKKRQPLMDQNKEETMADIVFKVWIPEEYRQAGPSDLMELRPAPGQHPLFMPKHILESLVYGICHFEMIHLSGPTGSAKSSLLEAIYRVPENFQAICQGLGFPFLPLKLYPVEMATFEAPGELFQRRSLKNGSTYDEKSLLVQALEEAIQAQDTYYNLIWLREIGRVHSASVQGGLLNLMYKGDIVLPDGSRLDGRAIAWVADSNYQAEHDATHTLCPLDDALKRRFSLQLSVGYLDAAAEIKVLEYILREGGAGNCNQESLVQVVQLGQTIRQQRAEGNLLSVPPPTIYGYLALLRMAHRLPHLGLRQAAASTILGNASQEDQKVATSVFAQVFGLQAQEDDPTLGGHLF